MVILVINSSFTYLKKQQQKKVFIEQRSAHFSVCYIDWHTVVLFLEGCLSRPVVEMI